MKTPKSSQTTDDMRPEYDFSRAERGKFHKPLDQGYRVHIEQEDGATVVNHFTLAEGAVLLEPDVRAYFPDSESVNAALRAIIDLTQKVSPPKSAPSTHQVADRK